MKEFLAQRQLDGLSLSAAVREVASICAASERTVWRWVGGTPVPAWARRLLRVWAECSLYERERWFC